MLKSMTAYGRSSIDTLQGRFNIEIQSVNKRHYELQCFLPGFLQRFDAKIRNLLNEHIHRGQVTLRVSISTEGEQSPYIHVNRSLLKQYINAWQTIADEIGYGSDYKVPLNLFSNIPGLLGTEELKDETLFWEQLQEGIQAALIAFTECKKSEGAKLREDLEKRAQKISLWRAQVEEKSRGSSNKYRDKLKEKLEEILPGSIENDERLYREVAIYADKIDIAEEIVRLKAHLEKLHELLNTQQHSVGKEIEFLLQEITREINTTGAKSSELEVIQLVLSMKNEVERIKEQVQNVE